MRAIETTGTIDENRQLRLDSDLPLVGPSRVKVILLLPEDDDMGESEWLRGGSNATAFSFLDDAEEDVYSRADGRPFSDQR